MAEQRHAYLATPPLRPGSRPRRCVAPHASERSVYWAEADRIGSWGNRRHTAAVGRPKRLSLRKPTALEKKQVATQPAYYAARWRGMLALAGAPRSSTPIMPGTTWPDPCSKLKWAMANVVHPLLRHQITCTMLGLAAAKGGAGPER